MAAIERYQPPRGLSEIERLAGHFAASRLFGNGNQTQSELVTKMIAGAENGIPPFAAASGIHIIQGKAEVGADLLARMVKESPKYDYRVREMTEQACVLAFYENGEQIGESSFTLEDAKAAGLAGKDMYRKFARNMLFARAMSNGVAWFCPDVSSSRLYAAGEIERSDEPIAEPSVTVGEIVVEAEPQPEEPADEQTLLGVVKAGIRALAADDSPTGELRGAYIREHYGATLKKAAEGLIADYGEKARDLAPLVDALMDAEFEAAATPSEATPPPRRPDAELPFDDQPTLGVEA